MFGSIKTTKIDQETKQKNKKQEIHSILINNKIKQMIKTNFKHKMVIPSSEWKSLTAWKIKLARVQILPKAVHVHFIRILNKLNKDLVLIIGFWKC